MHNGVTSHLWLKSALHASSHSCMCTCVLRLGCFLLACPVLYFVPPFSFQPFLMFTSAFNERSRSNPLCDFRLGTVVTSDHETPLTVPTAAPSLGKMSRHLLLQACALHRLRVQFGDVSSAFLQTSASEEDQELTIKAPTEVGYLFSDSERKPARHVRLMKSFVFVSR